MQKYLQSFKMPSKTERRMILDTERRTVIRSNYPIDVFSYRGLPTLEFGPITIICGGNGSGKSTILNVIAEKLELKRGSVYNRTKQFDEYVRSCSYHCCPGMHIPSESRIITSDEVFDFLLDIRYINDGIDNKREELFDTYFDKRNAEKDQMRIRSLNDYARWKDVMDAKRGNRPNPHPFVRERVMKNITQRSNGESALLYFMDEILENALYLLDEPENSMAVDFQLELKEFLEASARGCSCQFIIATHSPILLSIKGAVIYDLDDTPPKIKKWTEVKNMQVYYDFFMKHSHEFTAGPMD